MFKSTSRGRILVELACSTKINNQESTEIQEYLQIPSQLLQNRKTDDFEITYDAEVCEAPSTSTSNKNESASVNRPYFNSVAEPNDSPCVVHEDNEGKTTLDQITFCQNDYAYDFENTDDSVQDPGYTPSSDSGNKEENGNGNQENNKVIEDQDEDINNEETYHLEEKATLNQGVDRPKKGRKRMHLGQTCQSRKKLRDSNKPHFSVKGMYCSPKKFNDFNCNCPKRCNDQVPTESRKKIFDKFWNLGSYDCQTAFIAALIQEVNTKRKRSSSNKRQYSRYYQLDKVNICRKMFINTLGISAKRVNTALNKIRSDCVNDKRGTHRKGVHRISPDEIQKVKDHINMFPRYKSHYCRAESGDTEYLSTELTESKMYELYKEENGENGTVSSSCYRNILHTNFNIKRKKLKKDTCNKCDSFHAAMQNGNSIYDKETIENDLNVHQSEAKGAREAMNCDLKTAKECEHIETLCYDMEKTLPLPRIPTNVIYYKRQIWVYNTGIHSGKENKSFFYVWVEGTAGRGAQEVGSCLRKHILTHIGRNVTDLILWSDSCGGQNRNIKMVLMMNTLFDDLDSLNSVTLKYLISGHSYLPNDSDFGDVESALKNQQRLYDLEDYIKVMKGCRKKRKFVVSQMMKDDFKGTKEIEMVITNRKVDTKGNKINWLTLREIKLEKSKPSILQMKTSHSQIDHIQVDIKSKQRGRPSDSFHSAKLISLWPDGKPITKEKLKDIESIRHLIPNDVWPFYQKLYSSTEVEDDIDGFGNNVDFAVDGE